MKQNEKIQQTYLATFEWIQSHLATSFPQALKRNEIELIFLFSPQDPFADTKPFLNELKASTYTPSGYLEKFHRNKEELILLCESLETVISEKLQRKKFKDAQATNEKNHLFKPYYKEDELNVGIKNGQFHQGKFIVSENRKRAEVLVLPDSLLGIKMGALFIPKEFRNRAINGDTVVVELLSNEEYPTMSNPDIKAHQKVAKVVGVLQRYHFGGNPVVGTIELQKGQNENQIKKEENFLVIPLDRKFPKIRIRTQVASQIIDSRILIQMDSWDKDSHYPTGMFLLQSTPKDHQLPNLAFFFYNCFSLANRFNCMSLDLLYNFSIRPFH